MRKLRAGIVGLVVLLGGAAFFLWTERHDPAPGSAEVQEGPSAAERSGTPVEPERLVAGPDAADREAPAPGAAGVVSALTVTGIVVDEQNVPVAEARVFHGGSSADPPHVEFVLTDSAGRFAVSSTHFSLHLRAEKEGYRVSDVYETGHSAGSPEGIRIVLRRASGTNCLRRRGATAASTRWRWWC